MCLQTNTNLHLSVTMQNMVVLCVDFFYMNDTVCILCDSFSSAFSIAFAVSMLYKSTLFFLTFHTFLWDRFSLILTVIHLCINIWVYPIVFHFDTNYCNVHLFYTRSDLNRIFLYSRNEGREFLGHVHTF